MSQTNIKGLTDRDENQWQHNPKVPVFRQQADTMVRDDVLWQKNILPEGVVDWVIVGFSALVLVEKEIKAEADIGEDFEKSTAGDIATAVVPIAMENMVMEDKLGLIVGEGSGKSAAKAFNKQGAFRTKLDTKETAVLEKKANFEDEEVGMSSGVPNEGSEEVITELENGAKPVPLKGLRDRSANQISLTPSEVFKASKWLIQATPKIPRRSLQSRNTSPKLPPTKQQQHPAEVLKSWGRSDTATSNNKTQKSKARLTTLITPTTRQPLATRPKTSVSVASRMITHALGLREVPRVRKPELESA
ncbi:hypothetical protein DSL72_000639 [Monilinia vaccinii-corymbosi]|uniref:Uncharacterized protein n=1 Tax=Monilinia vaccinii-corymbosi TaxID=61207 RepID=A0A8A3P8N3_9HELO|nr:hypothetical protein DSL72_000639 [Monilinia vaccinii-corymbosi]